ncbi:MAG: DMT family transporter [Sphingobium sp.]
MTFRDSLLVIGVCLAWAINTVISSFAIAPGGLTAQGLPPLFFAALRFAVVALFAAWWLTPMPPQPLRMYAVAMLMGFGHFGLTYVGLQSASTAAVGIVLQAGPPMTVILSVLLLGERLTAMRVVGIVLALSGVVLTVFDPGRFHFSTGLVYILAGQFAFAAGSVLMKKMAVVPPLQFQAWISVIAVPSLLATSALTESHQFERTMAGGWTLGLIALGSGLIASLWAHTCFFGLMRRYDGSFIAPLLLLSPILTVIFGIAFRGDAFGPRLAVGACAALLGVFIATRDAPSKGKGATADALETNVAT